MKSSPISKRAFALLILALSLALPGCGGGGGGSSGGGGSTPTTYALSGRIQKGPLAIGSQMTVSELDANMNGNGKVYTVQTSDGLGSFAVSTRLTSPFVEIVGNGYYIDDLTGQLSASTIALRALVDLSVTPTPTVNLLTTLQAGRLKTLLTQGSSFAAAQAQSQREVLAAFRIDAAKVNALSTLSAMNIAGNGDADGVLLATSALVSRMASDAAINNRTTQAAELSSLINTMAAQLSANGAISNAALLAAMDLAATEINPASVRTNLGNYYASQGTTLQGPKFEEWIDVSGSRVLPQRLATVAGLAFAEVNDANPAAQVTSAPFTVAGLGGDLSVAVTIGAGATLLKNGSPVPGGRTVARDGDSFALQLTAPGYRQTSSASLVMGASSATWKVNSRALSGSISGLLGTGLVLSNDGADTVSVAANGTSFNFPGSQGLGSRYSVTVLTQPKSPLQVCRVTNGTGSVGSATGGISIVCSAEKQLLVATEGSTIATYSQDPSNGELLAASSTSAPVTNNAGAVTTHPKGSFIYVVLHAPATAIYAVQPYAINTETGALSPLAGVTLAPGETIMQRLVFSPDGKFAYLVLNASVHVYAVEADGTLRFNGKTSFSAPTSSARSYPHRLAIDPTGKFAYLQTSNSEANVVSQFSYGIYAYSIDALTGLLTQLPGGPHAPSRALRAGADTVYNFTLDSAGRIVYVISGATVTEYSVDPTSRALTALSAGLYQGDWADELIIDPSGKFAYVVGGPWNGGQGTIAALSINAGDGRLSAALPGDSFNVALQPTDLLFDPSGKFVYQQPFGNNIVPSGSGVIDAYNSYSLSPGSGTLTPIHVKQIRTGRFIALVPVR